MGYFLLCIKRRNLVPGGVYETILRYSFVTFCLLSKLCVAAQEYADKLAASGHFEHSGDQRS